MSDQTPESRISRRKFLKVAGASAALAALGGAALSRHRPGVDGVHQLAQPATASESVVQAQVRSLLEMTVKGLLLRSADTFNLTAREQIRKATVQFVDFLLTDL